MRSVPVQDDTPTRQLDPDRLGDHVDRLFRAAWAMTGRREDAEDLVQETYARVLAKPRFVRRQDDLAYLLRVLRNTHVSRLRSRSRRPAEVTMDDHLEPADQSGHFRPEAFLDATSLFAAIGRLPDPFREAIVAVDVVGLTYREAGDTFGVPEATITSRLHRARLRVARELSAEGDGRR
jgi:RNA polymerase sigma-70 factor (ECF subfamily)